MEANQLWFCTCPKGIEGLLFDELSQLGAAAVRETVGGCHFEGSLAVGYRVALWSRLANRLLMSLGQFAMGDSDTLHDGVQALPWADFMAETASFLVDFSGHNGAIRNTQYGAQVCKDGIVDYFTARGVGRPSVQRQNPDVRINVRLRKGHAEVAIDFVGSSLHQRGYRANQGAAPLKENLAAAILMRADWPGIAARGGALIDPMCGSGTLLLEGAAMVADIAPGLGRRRWGFEKLRIHNAAQWQTIQGDAKSRAVLAQSQQLPEIRGYDVDLKMVLKAEANIKQAGVDGIVRVSRKPLSELVKPTHKPLPHGLIISNPPYGERLGEVTELRQLYRQLGEVLVQEFAGWQAAILTSEKELGMAVGLRSHKRYPLFNGAVPVSLLLFDLQKLQALPERSTTEVDRLSEGAKMLLNRLRKNRKKWDSWARKKNLECFRVYDADMPEYSVAIDRYGDYLQVAEYRAPKTIKAADSERRMREVTQVVPLAFEVGTDKIFYKRRERQRGKRQYEAQDERGERVAVREGQAEFLVNLTDYLDTGLFLDHRPLRLMLAGEARGKRFLNLFCYTASASVHAALGGAVSTTSVDMSKTYLSWARRNFERNQISAADNHLIQADCMHWLEHCSDTFDLILLDPPSFSNSKRMASSLDIQRDHLQLLALAMARLEPAGRLYFSNNLRSFKLDSKVESWWRPLDISRSTVDDDFARRPNIHRCWMIETD